MKIAYRSLLIAIAATATLAGQRPAFADPPSWAPAHGERDQERDRDWDSREDRHEDRNEDRNEDRRDHDDYHYVHYGHEYWHDGHYRYRGYHGDDWDQDYGVVRSGRCDTNVLLGAAGAVTGAVIGNRTSSPENRGIATVFGAIAGGIIGTAVGGAIDDGDRACIGHSLELAPVGHPVYWRNPRSQVYWRMVPLRDVSPVCREFQVYREFDGRRGGERIIACRRNRGYWDIRS